MSEWLITPAESIEEKIRELELEIAFAEQRLATLRLGKAVEEGGQSRSLPCHYGDSENPMTRERLGRLPREEEGG